MKLTQQENAVFTLIGRGFTDREAAKELRISIRTVQKHMNAVKLKLGAKNRVNAGIIYLRLHPDWDV